MFQALSLLFLFVSLLHAENCVYKHGTISDTMLIFNKNCCIEYLHRKLLAINFLSYDIEKAKKRYIDRICILKQSISCSITMYLILAKID